LQVSFCDGSEAILCMWKEVQDRRIKYAGSMEIKEKRAAKKTWGRGKLKAK
jgi:hypothetical protein